MRRSLSVRTERKLIRSFRNVIVVSPELAAEVARIAPRSAVHAIPLALDLDLYGFVPPERRPVDPVVAMIGSMDWPPSRYAAERLLTRLWPEIRKTVPNAALQITGRKARSVLRAYLNVPGAKIEEDVASTQPYFEHASVLLYAPERGSGVKVKVLEAFAYGLPVVTTPPGVEGLDVEDGVHAGVHESDEGLVQRVLELLREPARQEAQRRAARHLLATKYTPVAVIERLEHIYAMALDECHLPAAPETEVSNQYAGH
jgi:glycosyltransferase involved in cell wall biosynthesis